MICGLFFFIFFFTSHFYVIFWLFWGAQGAPHLCPMYPYGPWPLVLLFTRHIEEKTAVFMIFCLIKQVYTIKNRMFLLIWARLEPPTEVQIFLNCPKWSHTPSFMYWQEDQL